MWFTFICLFAISWVGWACYLVGSKSEVIKAHFAELSQTALDLLRKKADEALVAEKKELQDRLARIEALEKRNEGLKLAKTKTTPPPSNTNPAGL